ncbi:hypothetical protein EK21DRAFT_57730 [Setomelanomma holmii]|uniref:DH domain-containing protein n=1 Tax=Setomelanomma holmii TaxID=210430 RepID=A0A9P4HHT1_9PLEO|nr:hypothetical protein EK21DRAFT_57730 [Setomelanomma holmii]
MAESDQVHNYAYPTVASWLHSTSLAQLDGTHEPKHVDVEDPLDASPDDFYKSAYTTTQHEIAPPPPVDMAASRVRQPTANGAVRPPPKTTPKTTPRSASGPASSATTTRSSPQVSNKVKALAERFERSPGGGVPSTAPAVRSRSKEPTRAGPYDPARRSGASMSSTASAARPNKEAAYGTYKFNNLKPRERPQPAPASPRNATTRRTAGSRSSLDQQIPPTRKKVASPSRRPASSGRQPFFGEVVSGQDLTSPGFGIPTFDGTEEEVPGVDTVLETPADEPRLPASIFKFPHHDRSASAATTSSFAGEGPRAQTAQSTPARVPVRPSPTSRIPPLQPSPAREAGPHAEHGYFPSTSAAEASANDTSYQFEETRQEQPQSQASGHHQRLSLQTSRLSVPPTQQPLSATTDFEESPVLGIPGSFVLTPPTAHEEATPQLLQPAVFNPSSREQAPKSPEIEESELGVRESIPIMLGDDQSQEPWQVGANELNEGLQALDYSYGLDRGYPTHYEMGDSPIDSFSNRDTLRPDDSASVAPYRAADPLTFNRETYSVVNSVLNMYHQSPVISPELASVSQERVQRVSPVIAQHKDWGSKEATETYLARLLSDANGGEEQSSRSQERGMTSTSGVSIDQHTTPMHASQPPFSHQYPLPSTHNEQVEQHPARAHTPVHQAYEDGLEARYGAAQSTEMAAQTAAPVEAAENGQPDPAKQALIKRYRILEELLTTEHQFCIDMMIAHNIFEATAQSLMTEKEKKILFSNCKELEKFSLSLFRAFKKAAKPIVNYDIPPPTGPWNRDSSDSRPSNPSDASLNICRPSEDSQNQFENCTLENDHQTTVGQVFLENKEKMERLYTTYYLNQENAAAYIKKHQNNPELTGWVAACFEQVENMTQAWDLDSLLLKPCQRLLKYPLLLDSLENSTDAGHPDLPHIKEARKELLAMSARINEAKKRADTFRAATSEGKKEKTKGKGIGKTFVKAFIPKVDKNKAYDEADKTFKDQDYKSREQKFGGHFFQLQIVIRDFEQYLDAITEHYQQLNIVFMGFVTVSEVAPSVHPELESTWRKWAMAHFELQNKALEDHKIAVRNRVLKPVADLWEMWVAYQKTIEQRKKFLLYYVKHKQAVDRGEKVDADLEESAKKFTTINDTLKHELPLLYERTKGLMRTLMTLFMCLQKDWYKTCSKKILPLLESEPQHTTSLRYDLESYVERFNSDYKPMQDLANRLGIINRNLLIDISNMTSPVPTLSSDSGSARNSTNRRTESIGSEASIMDLRNRHSGGYGGGSRMRPHDTPPRSSPAGMAYPSLTPGRSGLGPTSLREARALSPVSDNSDATVMHSERRNTGPSRQHNYLGLDGAVDFDDRSPLGSSSFDFPPQLGASFLAPTSQPMTHSYSQPTSQTASLPGSQRASGVFSSALPMSDSPVRGSVEELPATPGDTDEPEVLFLAASLFEFNIAHDRREGGIPYLVYVPGEIFDVIGMKGELWLARNQDDPTKTVGWIWEKHFARILPEDA